MTCTYPYHAREHDIGDCPTCEVPVYSCSWDSRQHYRCWSCHHRIEYDYAEDTGGTLTDIDACLACAGSQEMQGEPCGVCLPPPEPATPSRLDGTIVLLIVLAFEAVLIGWVL